MTGEPLASATLANELAEAATIRRYGVPPAMMDACAAALAAGDWRGGFAAARIDVQIDLGPVRRRYGAAEATRIEDDLTHTAPDLLRWHLPAAPLEFMYKVKHYCAVLAPPVVDEDTPVVRIDLPLSLNGPKRLKATVATRADLARARWFDLPRRMWDARRVGELRTAYGGSATRLPRFTADGEPLPVELWASAAAPDDPAADSEWLLRLVDEGKVAEAWQYAGIDLDPQPPPSTYWPPTPKDLGRRPFHLPGLAAELRRLATAYGPQELRPDLGNSTICWFQVTPDGAAVAARLARGQVPLDRPAVAPAVWRRPIDLDLIWHGRMTVDELHPLIREVLFPVAPAPAPAPAARPTVELPAVRVRCGTAWHTVQMVDGNLRAPAHTDDEIQRERLMGALGGSVCGCVAAQQAWREAKGRLPRGLRDLRRELFRLAVFGNTEAVVAMLGAGIDARVRHDGGRTLLHRLTCMDHTTMLPLLLSRGLSVDTRDNSGRTPLFVAISEGGSLELIRALLDAGADANVRDENEMSLPAVVARRDKAARRAIGKLLAQYGSARFQADGIDTGAKDDPCISDDENDDDGDDAWIYNRADEDGDDA